MWTRRTTLKAGLGIVAGLATAGVDVVDASAGTLPALPLRAGAKLVGFGHSMIQRQAFSDPRYAASRANGLARGVLTWARASDTRYNVDIFANPHHPYNGARDKANFLDGAHQAIGGGHVVDKNGIAGTLTRTAYVLERQPDIIYLHIGENDVSSGIGANGPAPLIEALDRQLTLLTQAGCWVVIQTLMHRTTKSWREKDPRRGVVDLVNQWIKNQSGRPGVKICDTTTLGFNDPHWDPGLFGTDGTHINPAGALRIWTTTLKPILETMVSPGNCYDTDWTKNNLWPDAALLGTSGELVGGDGMSGEVASKWVVSRTNKGLSRIECSKESDIPGQTEKQVFKITPVDDAEPGVWNELRLRQVAALDLAGIGLSPGDWIETYLHVELSDWPFWRDLGHGVETYGQRAYRSADSSGLGNPDAATQALPLPAGGYAFWIKNRAFQIPPSATAIRFDTRPIAMRWLKSGTGTGVARISRPILRKMRDPRKLWNL